MRTITLEEHYSFPRLMEGRAQQLEPQIVEQLCDVGEGRIAAMDAAGIDVQVLSLASPGTEQLDPDDAISLAREANDRLAEAISRHPDRLAGFAALPTPAPDVAADELERTVRQHGFKGAMINGHTRGRRLDDRFFWPILERAEALDVPLYLHPAIPAKPVIDACYAGLAPEVTMALASYGWGWHIETALHVLRLILSGAFDRYPRLQLVIGHMGETLPFMMQRFQRMPPQLTKLERPVGAYLRQNVNYTFGGFNWMATFLDLLLEVGADRIMFSADHPWGSMAAARQFLEQIPVSPDEREQIAYGNAARLLNGVGVPA